MLATVAMFALVGKVLAFVVLGPIIILALLAYILLGKVRK